MGDAFGVGYGATRSRELDLDPDRDVATVLEGNDETMHPTLKISSKLTIKKNLQE